MEAAYQKSRPMQYQLCSEIATFLTASIALIVVQVAGNPDAFTAVGAMLATAIIFLEARDKKRSWLKTGSNVIGSFFCGAVVPGGFLWWKFPEFAVSARWQIWAGAGFVAGLVGWGTVASAVAIYEARRDMLLKKAADRLFSNSNTGPTTTGQP